MKENGSDYKRQIINCTKEGRKHADNGRYTKAFTCYHSAFEAACALDSEAARLSCAFNIGALCVLKTEDYKKGVEYLEKAISPGNGDSNNAEVFSLLGRAHEQLGSLEKAYEYYCKAMKICRCDRNAEKELEALEKMVVVSKKQNESQQAYDHINELIRVCDVLRDGDVADPSSTRLKRLKWMVEKGIILRGMNEPKKSLDIAKDCLEELSNQERVRVRDADIKEVHGIFNDLGLLLTHLQEYETAARCFRKVLELIPNLTRPQLAISKQNLGAIYNFLNLWKEAIPLHKEAAELHAAPHSRACQGHCYCNLAYAYFQLAHPGDQHYYHKASIFYHLANEAAKEAGDEKTQWQALEGLGIVALKQEDSKEAAKFFREAFTRAARTSDKETQVRIMGRMQQALVYNSSGPPSVSGCSTPSQQTGRGGTMQTFIRHPTINNGGTMSSVDGNMNTLVAKENVTKEPKRGGTGQTGAEKRILKVRRSGSLRKFDKVALGLQTTMDSVMEERDDSEISDETTSGDRDSDTDVDSDEGPFERPRPPLSGSDAKRMASLTAQSTQSEEEEEKDAVRKNMMKYLSEEDEDDDNNDDDGDDDDDDDEDDDDDDDDNEEAECTVPKRPISAQRLPASPPIQQHQNLAESPEETSPSSSSDDESPRELGPSKSSVAHGTYEEPVASRSGQQTSSGNYAEIDFDRTAQLPQTGEKPTPGKASSKKHLTLSHRNSNNFFLSSDEDRKEGVKKRPPSLRSSTKESDAPSSSLATVETPSSLSTASPVSGEVARQSGEQGPSDPPAAAGDSNIYETVRPSTSHEKSSPDKQSPTFDNPRNIPRAEREKILFQYHQQREDVLTAEKTDTDEEGDKKKSKTCIVM